IHNLSYTTLFRSKRTGRTLSPSIRPVALIDPWVSSKMRASPAAEKASLTEYAPPLNVELNCDVATGRPRKLTVYSPVKEWSPLRASAGVVTTSAARSRFAIDAMFWLFLCLRRKARLRPSAPVETADSDINVDGRQPFRGASTHSAA